MNAADVCVRGRRGRLVGFSGERPEDEAQCGREGHQGARLQGSLIPLYIYSDLTYH